MDLQYEERFGVKVDTRIPAALKAWLCDEFEAWKTGNVEVSRRSLLTRYEHFIYGSGVPPTPDPFKPLALQHEGADLGAVIEARRRVYPPGKEDIGICKARHYITEDFERVTGLDRMKHFVIAQYPEIDENGRIRIPKIVAAMHYHEGIRIDFNEDVISKLQLPTSREVNWRGTNVREVFDFTGGYRIELVQKKEDS